MRLIVLSQLMTPEDLFDMTANLFLRLHFYGNPRGIVCCFCSGGGLGGRLCTPRLSLSPFRVPLSSVKRLTRLS